MVAALRSWLGLLARLDSTTKAISSALGKLAWARRPAGGAGTFTAGIYRALHGAEGTKVRVPTSALRGIGVGVMLAHMPHKFPHGQKTGFTFFSDTAERPERQGAYRVGVVGLTGVHRSYKCPRWVASLQQAELWGLYLALKICVYITPQRHPWGGGRMLQYWYRQRSSQMAVHQGSCVIKPESAAPYPTENFLVAFLEWVPRHDFQSPFPSQPGRPTQLPHLLRGER